MATGCDSVFADLLPDRGTVPVKVVQEEKEPKRTSAFKHIMDGGKREKKQKKCG